MLFSPENNPGRHPQKSAGVDYTLLFVYTISRYTFLWYKEIDHESLFFILPISSFQLRRIDDNVSVYRKFCIKPFQGIQRSFLPF